MSSGTHTGAGADEDGERRRDTVRALSRLRSADGLVNPHPVYDELHRLGEVVPAPWGGAVLVTGFEAADQVLRGRDWLTPDFAWQSRRPDPRRWQSPATVEMTRTLSRLNAPEHPRQRRALGNLFDRGTLGALQVEMGRHAEALLDELDGKLQYGEADFVPTVAEQLPMRTVGGWLGLPTGDHEHILAMTHDQAYAQELLPTRSELAVSEDATRRLRTYFTALLRERRAAPDEGVISGWIRTWDELEPDREQADEILYSLVMFITVASLETTATLLSTLVWQLLKEPGRWRELRAHREGVEDAVEEALRFDPPIQLNTRVAREDTVLAGVPVAADTMAHVMYGPANHDPARNPDPHRFAPDRKGAHLSFGGGFHYCLGSALARMEATVLLGRMLDRYPALSVTGGPGYARRMVFRRMTTLGVSR